MMTERIAGDIKAQHLLLECQHLRLRPGRDRRQTLMVFGIIISAGHLPEEIHLPGLLVGLQSRPVLHRPFQAGLHLRPVSAELIEGAGLDERLEHLLIGRP